MSNRQQVCSYFWTDKVTCKDVFGPNTILAILITPFAVVVSGEFHKKKVEFREQLNL